MIIMLLNNDTTADHKESSESNIVVGRDVVGTFMNQKKMLTTMLSIQLKRIREINSRSHVSIAKKVMNS